MQQSSIENIKIIELPLFKDIKKGSLIATESKNLSIEIKRGFQIIAPKNSIRGEHSHKIHTQIMICSSGVIEIECDDGKSKKTFSLSRPNIGLSVPPNIWSKQTYKTDQSILTVFADAEYDESEYVRDYRSFLKLKNIN